MNNFLKNRNIGIDLLRGLCILYIVGFWHMFNYTGFPHAHQHPFTVRITQMILSTFVFISGYFIGNKNIAFSLQDLFKFYKKRLMRIYPLYIIAIFLFMILKLSDTTTLFKAGIIVSMFMKPVPPTLWFIAMLLIFYIISPILIGASNIFNATRLTIYYMFFIVILIAYSDATGLLDLRFIMYFPSFALGIFVANKNTPLLKENYTVRVISVVSISFLFSFLETPDKRLNALIVIPMMLSCSYFLFRVAKQLDIPSKQLHKLIFILSYSSYCMYLFHRPIYVFLKEIYFPDSYLYQIVYLDFFCLPCILCCSFIVQKAYDFTIDTLTNKSRERKRSNHLI